MNEHLRALKRATARREKAESDWRDAIIRARPHASIRDIGKQAGVSHVRVVQIVREHA